MFHNGYRKEGLVVDSFHKIFFKGFNVTTQTFNYLIKQKNLANATDAVIAGFSAGGCAVYAWANYFRNILPPSVLVKAVSDSGFFLDYVWGTDFFKASYETIFESPEVMLPKECVYNFSPQDMW